MEEAQIEASKTPTCFPPCRKTHLKSQTSFTLVRILSQCANSPQLCGTAQAGDTRKQIPDNSSDEPGDDLVPPQNDISISGTVKAIGIQDEGLAIGNMISEIENIMNTEEDDDPCKQNNLTVNNCTAGTGMEDADLGNFHQLMEELEHVIEGNEEVARETNYNVSTGGNQCAGDDRALLESQRHVDLHSTATPKCSNAALSTTCEISTLRLNNNEVGSSVAIQEKEMDFGKHDHASEADSFLNLMTEGNKEEGEISGDLEVGGKSVMPIEDVVVPQEQREHRFEYVDRDKFPSIDKEEENRKDFTEKAEFKDVKNEVACKRKLVVYGDPILAEGTDRRKRQKKDCEAKGPKKANVDKGKKKGNAGGQIVCTNNSVSLIRSSDQTTGDKRINTKSKQMQDAGVCNKKSQGPPSEGKKEKKKEKKRKKRAQKNRELGVKRLKLRPVQKPKPIVFCQHYMNGRCHEGEKCKFSHDTVPLTKSKPCGHFARNSCLKGDDCPFDHELSKYPCNNYASTGSCSRGEACLFSHKLPIKENLPSTPNISTPDLKATSLPGSRQVGATLGRKNTAQNVAKIVLSPPVLPPKGISFMSTGKPSNINSSHSTPSSSCKNLANQSTPEKTQNSNDMPKGSQPTIAPKGINFLSFGKAHFSSPIQTTPMTTAIQVSEDKTKSVSIDRLIQAIKMAPNINQGSSVRSQEPEPPRATSRTTSLGSSQNVAGPSVISQEPPRAVSIGLSQSANSLACSWLKDAPNSAQKAFMSTLAFAAKVESESKMKQSTVKEIGDNTQISSKNDSMRALKILDILSSISGNKRE